MSSFFGLINDNIMPGMTMNINMDTDMGILITIAMFASASLIFNTETIESCIVGCSSGDESSGEQRQLTVKTQGNSNVSNQPATPIQARKFVRVKRGGQRKKIVVALPRSARSPRTPKRMWGDTTPGEVEKEDRSPALKKDRINSPSSLPSRG